MKNLLQNLLTRFQLSPSSNNKVVSHDETDIYYWASLATPEEKEYVNSPQTKHEIQVLGWLWTNVPYMIGETVNSMDIISCHGVFYVVSFVPDGRVTRKRSRFTKNLDPILPIIISDDLIAIDEFRKCFSDLVWYIREWVENKADNVATNPNYMARTSYLVDRIIDYVWTHATYNNRILTPDEVNSYHNALKVCVRNPRINLQ